MSVLRAPSPKALIAVLSFAAVVSVAVVDFGRTAPGELLAAHARFEGLADADSCSQCHGGWTSSMTASCLECHETIRAHVDGGIGLHGVLDATVAENCAGCHSDHHGRGFQAVNDLSFARAGVADRRAFDHGLIGFDMRGEHTELECTGCHEHAETEIVPEGARRYFGLNQSCVTCHDDVHEGAFSTTCTVCHDQTSFTDHHFNGHASFLELAGPHADVSCRECHAEGSEHSLEILRGPESARPVSRSCAECHDQPHGESFVLRAATVQGVLRAADLVGRERNKLCAGCHEPHQFSFTESSVSPDEHAASGFSLTQPHNDLECAACHDPVASWSERYAGRDADSCAACHEDPHAGQFEGLAFAQFPGFAGGAVDDRGCLVCHARTHFEPHAFDEAAHASTDLPLTGAHRELACDACHDDVSGVRTFHGIEHTCEACHRDAHEGFFATALAQLDETPKHGDCARCHDPSAFSHVPEGRFDHKEWTGYALTGSHLTAECKSCHAPSETPDAAGRTFGRVTDLYGTVEGCSTCHDDVHESRFDAVDLPETTAGREDCARCHSTASFRSLPHGFDHELWTGWALDDAHAAVDCTACHAPLRRPDDSGRTWGRAAGTSCASCHDSPHGDQFGAIEGHSLRAKDCTKCHKSAASFSVLSFDHDLESRFALDDAHEKVSCSGCHTAPEVEGDPVLYRPMDMDCVDCHGVHERALRKRRR